MYLHTHDMYVCLLYVGIRKSWSYMLSISKGEKAWTTLKMDLSKTQIGSKTRCGHLAIGKDPCCRDNDVFGVLNPG